jgi:hypothetical protein
MERKIDFDGYTFDIAANGHTTVRREHVDTSRPGDHGADPVGDGTFRMVPSGDVVSYEERCRRLGRPAGTVEPPTLRGCGGFRR